MIMFCTKKKIVQEKCTILGPKMEHPHNSGLALRIFLKILQNERLIVNENFISCFSRKKFIWTNVIFLGYFLLFDWAWSKLSQATVTIGSF